MSRTINSNTISIASTPYNSPPPPPTICYTYKTSAMTMLVLKAILNKSVTNLTFVTPQPAT